MTRRGIAPLVGAWAFVLAATASAEPILKPHKYEGPIPRSAVWLRVGAMGGANNDEMIAYLDERVRDPFEVFPEDFGTSLSFDLGYMHKPHPRFGARVNASATFLSYTSRGNFVPQVAADSLLPALDYQRELKVDLLEVELGAIYYFTDAAVSEFQPYIGGGFSLGFPHESYEETRIDTDTGRPYTAEIPGRVSEASEWGFSPGVHAVLGLFYYLTNRWAVSAETRVQLMEGRFEALQAVNEVNDFENVSFVVEYSGFLMTLGLAYAF